MKRFIVTFMSNTVAGLLLLVLAMGLSPGYAEPVGTGPMSIIGSAVVRGPVTVEGSLTVAGDILVRGPLTAARVRRVPPDDPSLHVRKEENTFYGPLTVRGPLTVYGNLEVRGPLIVDGPVAAVGSIDAEGPIVQRR
jgi:cytoskeletal protein CcmA (bactofilin family)